MKRPPRRKLKCRRKSGLTLVLVLVTITLLSLSLYAFAESMLAEYRVVRFNIHSAQQSQVARSGIEIVARSLSSRDHFSRAGFLYDPRSTSQTVGEVDGLKASYALVHMNPSAPSSEKSSSSPDTINPFIPGLENESGKLNVNSLPLEESRSWEARARLTALPGVDLKIADSILDWMDEDDDSRPVGAETNFYSERGYRPRQGRLKSLRELLKVQGITQELLFGEDHNGNGWLDPNENDGDLSLPADNADGLLDRGLSEWITIDGAESVLNNQGVPKTNVNGNDLNQIYGSLVPVVGARAAQFIVAYRIEGPLLTDKNVTIDLEELRQRRLDTAEARLRRHLGIETPVTGPAIDYQDSFRAGIDLSRKGAYKIGSLLELIGSRVLVMIDTEQEILSSPWERNAQTVRSTLVQLESVLTTTDAPIRMDRINPVSAPREVLRTIPEMSEPLVTRIVQSRQRILSDGSSNTQFQSIAWLMADAGLSFDQLLKLSPYLTAGGDVFRGFSLGRLQGVRSQSVIRFEVSATGPLPNINFVHQLRPIPIFGSE